MNVIERVAQLKQTLDGYPVREQRPMSLAELAAKLKVKKRLLREDIKRHPQAYPAPMYVGAHKNDIGWHYRDVLEWVNMVNKVAATAKHDASAGGKTASSLGHTLFAQTRGARVHQ